MISLVLAAAAAHGSAIQALASHLVLSRGAVVNGVALWDVEDATLDGAKPNENSQGDPDLEGGPLKTILIRFGDLGRLVGAHQRVVGARLILVGGAAGANAAISRVLVPWGEGPFRTLGGFSAPAIPGATAAPPAPIGAATWRDCRAGVHGGGWEEAGARGGRDAAAIPAAKFVDASDRTSIDGLADAVQSMVDHPNENHGFAITLGAPVGFASSESPSDRPRLELDLTEAGPKKGADLSVLSIERAGADGKLPTEGQEAVFTAHVKNVGDAPAKGFTLTWSIDEHAGVPEPAGKALAPGEETTVTYRLPYHVDKADHRFQTLTLTLRPDGGDANPRNDALRVWTGGRGVEVVVPPAVAAKIGGWLNCRGSNDVSDWVQNEVAVFNDVYLACSRFSFAPDGALERVAVQRVLVGDSASLPAPTDGAVRVVVKDNPSDDAQIDAALMRDLGVACGLVDRSLASIPSDHNELAPNGGLDRFPGVMGYGDTRFEGFAPGQIELPYDAYSAPIFDNPPLEATGLLAASDVMRLNAAVAGRSLALPKTVFIRALTQTNLPLPNLKLDFFATANGTVPKGATPAFSVTTAESGNVFLPTHGASVFGAADPAPGADAYFVRATLNGAIAGDWFKAWQVFDSAARGGPGAAAAPLMELHFNLPAATLDPGTDLATDRIVTDSTGSLPAKLAPIIDGSADTTAIVGGKSGDWVEIDLGRDRTIGEVDVVAPPTGFWNKFDIFVYGTGQRPEEATVWSREVDWRWTVANRAESRTGAAASVPYRGPAVQVRYLRFVSRVDTPGTVAEIRVVPVKNP